MYTGALPTTSNRETFDQSFQLNDNDTGDLVDLTDVSITFEIKDKEGCVKLTASTDDAITIVSTGIFEVIFTDTQMKTLCAGEYDIRCRYTDSDDKVHQLIIGSMAVVDG